MDNLRELWIEAAEPIKIPQIILEANIVSPSQTSTTPVQISTDLRKEMDGELPAKLKKITISGTGFTQLYDQFLDVSLR